MHERKIIKRDCLKKKALKNDDKTMKNIKYLYIISFLYKCFKRLSMAFRHK